MADYKKPLLICWGSADQVFPLKQGKALHAAVPQSEMVIFPGGGHAAYQEP
jgi:pimeloyl-ACP methyl ester carboxylesterase